MSNLHNNIINNSVNTTQLNYNVLDKAITREIKCLDQGWVKLVGVMPENVPVNYGVESNVIKSARTSTGNELKNIADDKGLIKYLYRHQHTSCFESVEFQFIIKCPKFVGTHFIRHRTANVNEFSARYAEVPDELYSVTSTENGLRTQNKINKQSSEVVLDVSNESNAEIVNTMLEAEELSKKQIDLYHRLIKQGVAKEIARSYLPQAMYTVINFKIDLHNFLKMIRLRMAPEAQYETRVFAIAMFELVKPLCPWITECFNNYTWNSTSLSRDECNSIAQQSLKLISTENNNIVKTSALEQKEYTEKLKKLNLLKMFEDLKVKENELSTAEITPTKTE